MAVISFASLKGGVGKTSLSVNVAHAFARRGNKVLLIDSDPAAHASRFFRDPEIAKAITASTLAKLFFSLRTRLRGDEEVDLLDAASELDIPLLYDVRENLSLLPGSAELHHFLWGPGARIFKKLFPQLIQDLSGIFDLIVFDTCPEFNVVTRSVIAASNVVVVPVDSSEMSISSLEEIFKSAQHIHGPKWAIVRTMVFRPAARVHRLTAARLDSSEEFKLLVDMDESSSNGGFIEKVKQVECGADAEQLISEIDQHTDDNRDIFLVDTSIHRTEQQNRLSFVSKTSFDLKDTKKLALEYASVAKELELLLSLSDGLSEEDSSPIAPLMSQPVQQY